MGPDALASRPIMEVLDDPGGSSDPSDGSQRTDFEAPLLHFRKIPHFRKICQIIKRIFRDTIKSSEAPILAIFFRYSNNRYYVYLGLKRI